MTYVYLVHHVHEFEDGHEDVKLIGVYTSEQRAKEAVARVRDADGFRDNPGGFSIDRHPLDQDGWVEGFVTA